MNILESELYKQIEKNKNTSPSCFSFMWIIGFYLYDELQYDGINTADAALIGSIRCGCRYSIHARLEYLVRSNVN